MNRFLFDTHCDTAYELYRRNLSLTDNTCCHISLDKAYPRYGIAKHKGYGTKEHMAALREFGPSPIHRTKFIRFLYEEAHE